MGRGTHREPNLAAHIDRVLDEIADRLRAKKSILCGGQGWTRRARAGGFDALEFVASVAIGGIIINGFQARISCRSDVVDGDVHAQLQLFVPSLNSYANVQRVEWRPARPHTNGANAPARLKFKRFGDRYYDFAINRRLGVHGLRQTLPMIAEELPRQINAFNDLLVLLREIWNADADLDIPSPPWEDRIV